MKYGPEATQMIDVSKIFLDQNNPRFDSAAKDQSEAIDLLCRYEKILPLAEDIAKIGVSPLELCAVIPDGPGTYFAAEGNRRLCAIKLLNDPDLAPAKDRKAFVAASVEWTPVPKLFSVAFDSRDEVRIWLDRIHAGEDEGRGRRQWNSDQKARNSVYSKNDLALTVLDIAEESGFITKEQRKGRLSVVERYTSNPNMKDVLGLVVKRGDSTSSDLPEKDFSLVLKKFISDVADKEISTRAKKTDIDKYSQNLRRTRGYTGERVKPWKLKDSAGRIRAHQKPLKARKPKSINASRELQRALRAIPSYKLEHLYESICSLKLEEHTPLLYVGVWSFIDTLTAICGRRVEDEEDFLTFVSKDMLKQFGVAETKSIRPIRDALGRIAGFGNSTKHNKTAAGFNGEQLENDFSTIEATLIALATMAKGKT